MKPRLLKDNTVRRAELVYMNRECERERERDRIMRECSHTKLTDRQASKSETTASAPHAHHPRNSIV